MEMQLNVHNLNVNLNVNGTLNVVFILKGCDSILVGIFRDFFLTFAYSSNNCFFLDMQQHLYSLA